MNDSNKTRVNFRSPWVDSIPCEWGQVKLGHISKIYSGGTPDKKIDEYWINGTVPWLNSGTVNQGLITEISEFISEQALANSSARWVPAGSLVMALAGQGKTKGMVAQLGIDATCNQSMAAIVFDEDHPRYMMYWLSSNYRNIRGIASDDTRDGLNLTHLKNIPCPRPSISEQTAIAAYLDTETKRIDGLIDAKKELRKLLEGFTNSNFISELISASREKGGKSNDRYKWLPVLPNDWDKCKLKHLVEFSDQGVSPQCESHPPEDGEWGVLKVGCINSGSFDPNESKALPSDISPVPDVTVCEGDLIISRANTKALVGRSAVAERDYPKLMLSDKLYRLKLNLSRCIPEFVRQMLWIPAVRDRIEERATGASQSMLNIDRRTIMELDLVLPSIEEQRQILHSVEERTTAIARLLAHVDSELELLKELRSSTITDAVLGRIDIRGIKTQ